MRRRFVERTVLVTGATSGIGRALAVAFAREGAHVTVHGRDTARLSAVVAASTEAGAASVRPLSLDLGQVEAIPAGLDAADRTLPAGLDVLVHAAGVITLGPVAETTPQQLRLNLSVNIEAPFVLTAALAPRVVRAKGQVVFVNSGAGLKANAGWAAYAASKHGLKALADSLREELKPAGVRVLSVYPGRTATPMQQRVRVLENAAYDPTAYIQPEDVATMVVEAVALPRSAAVVDLNIRMGAG